jgi:ComF family protein
MLTRVIADAKRGWFATRFGLHWWPNMSRILSQLQHLVDFCYPRLCPVCQGAAETGGELCPGCLQELGALENSAACDRCGAPIAEFNSPCPHCLGQGIKPFEGVLRLAVFQDPLRDLIHQIKYHGRWTVAEFLADRLIERKAVRALLGQTDVLVPVPLHPWRQMSRGYNQAEVIARRIGKRCGIKVASAVVRLRNTETQTDLHSRMKRYDNMRDAFGLMRPGAVGGRHVVVVDDVMTTGATLSSVGKTVLEAEPASLCAIVIAVADPRGRDFEMV